MINVTDFGVHRVSTKFEINKEKRTIVCIITTINDFPLRLEKYGLADDDYNENDFDVRVYRGVAKCSPEDDWDEAYGKHLAEYRAACARQSDINHDIKKYIHGISKCIDNLYDYGMLKDPRFPERQNYQMKLEDL